MNHTIKKSTPMDKKQAKYSKISKKSLRSKRKKDETEVFVIPPNLLQKLGINLGNVQITQECQKITETSSDTTRFNNINNSPMKNVTPTINSKSPENNKKETSILETANLMTKSVFLSPTFTPVCANIIPGELEISNALSAEKKSVDTAVYNSNNELNTNTIKKHENLTLTNGIADSEVLSQEILPTRDRIMENYAGRISLNKFENEQISPPVQENHIGFTDDVSKHINTDIIEKSDRKMSTDDHPDEAYSSDCSNSNLGPIENSDGLNYISEYLIRSPTQYTSKNKINIISEEILSPSQINELKNLHSPIVSDLIPVTINTVISWNKKNDKCRDQVLATDSLFYKQDNTKNSLKMNNIDNSNNSDDFKQLSIGLQGQNANINIFNESQYINKEQENICTIEKDLSQINNEEVLNDKTKLELENSDSNLVVCIDFEVMDIEKHLEDNVEILEEFVNGITSNDSDEIFEKLENNEKVQDIKDKTKFTEMVIDCQSDCKIVTDLISIKIDDVNQDENPSIDMPHTPLPIDAIDDQIDIDTCEDLSNIVEECELKKNVQLNTVTRAFNNVEVMEPINEDVTETNNDEMNVNIDVLQKSIENCDKSFQNNKQLKLDNFTQHNELDFSGNETSSVDIATKINDEIINDGNVSEVPIETPTNNNIPIEKIEEIAMYLSQCLSSSRLRSRTTFQNYKVAIGQNNQICPKSKLCIQGVEKPGGSMESLRNVKQVILKTYGRTNKAKKKNVPVLNETKYNNAILQNKSDRVRDLILQPTSIILSNDFTSREFCVCYDFGILAFYDCNHEYEHIHFWEHENIKCDRDIIFSIYTDDYSVDLCNANDADTITEISENNPEVTGYGICWNNIIKDRTSDIYKEATSNTGSDENLQNEPTHSENYAETTKDDKVSKFISNTKKVKHAHRDQSCDMPNIIVKIEYGESEFDSAGFQTAEPNKAVEIVNIERENEGKFTAGDKPSEDNIKINRHTSENILKPVDEMPHYVKESEKNQIIEETTNISSCQGSCTEIESGSSSNENDKKKAEKRKHSSNVVKDDKKFHEDNLQPSSKKSVQCAPMSTNTLQSSIVKSSYASSDKLNRTYSNPKRRSEELQLISMHSREGIKTTKSTSKAKNHKGTESESLLSEHIGARIISVDSQGNSGKRNSEALNPKQYTKKPKSTSTFIPINKEPKLPLVGSKATTKTCKSLSTTLSSTTESTETRPTISATSVSNSPKSTSKISEPVREDVPKSLPIPIKDTTKPRKSQPTDQKPLTKPIISESVSKVYKSPVDLKAMTKSSKLSSETTSKISPESTIYEPIREVIPMLLEAGTTKQWKSQSKDTESLTKSKSITLEPICEEHQSLTDDFKTDTKKRKSTSRNSEPKINSTKYKLEATVNKSPESTSTISTSITEDIKSTVASKAITKTCKLLSSTLGPTTESTESRSTISAASGTSSLKSTSKIPEPAREDIPKSFSMPTKATTKKRKSQPTDQKPLIKPKISESMSEVYKPAVDLNLSEKGKTKSINSEFMTKSSNSSSETTSTISPESTSTTYEPIREVIPVSSEAGTTVQWKSQSTDHVRLIKSKSNTPESISKDHQFIPGDSNTGTNKRKSKSMKSESMTNSTKYSWETTVTKSPESVSTISVSISDDPKLSTADSKAKKRKSMNLECITKSHKSTLSKPSYQDSDLLLHDSEGTIKKRKSQSIKLVSPIKDSKSASLCSDMKKEKNKSIPTVSENILVEPKPSESNDISKSKSINRYDFKDDPKPKSVTREYAESVATSKESKSKCKEDKSSTEAKGQRKSKSMNPASIVEDHHNNRDSTIQECEPSSEKSVAKCGVCHKEIEKECWIDHIMTEHDYLAWEDGCTPLNLDNEQEVHGHLYNLTKQIGGLKCSKCGITRKYVKSYLQHISNCDMTENQAQSSDIIKSSVKMEKTEEAALETPSVKCGVCEKEVNKESWIDHIIIEHNYLAWKDGETPVDFHDEEQLRLHLCDIVKQVGTLKCSKCGLSRKYAKSYIQHINHCEETVDNDGSAGNTTLQTSYNTDEVALEIPFVKCGVCEIEVNKESWMDHIINEHNYLAWKDGESPVDFDDEEQLYLHLYDIVKQVGTLKCSKCGLSRKYAKSYIQHINHCEETVDNDGSAGNTTLQTSYNTDEIALESPFVKCGVCEIEVNKESWMDHIINEHNYLAWKDGESPVDFDDEEQLYLHLYGIVKRVGSLKCSKCGLSRKYAKSYIQHINHCGETVDNDGSDGNATPQTSDNEETALKSRVTCGVCKKEISSAHWILHIQTTHNYMAWKEGEALDIDNEEEVQNHLYAISKLVGGLTCSKCGLVRKYVKAFQTHIENCTVMPPSYDDSTPQSNKGIWECGVCSEKVALKDWRNHKMENHYNIAWTSIQTPIDIKNPYAVERLLKEYKDRYTKLVCKVCGSSRASHMGFYAHILTCGKTEEEIDSFQNLCDICNKKYLCIYQNQHMTYHREQEYARIRKIKVAESAAKEKVEVEVDGTPGRRKAAEKARTVIENITTSTQFAYNCQTCGFGTDIRKKINKHVCKKEENKSNDSESSSEGSDDDSEESGNASELSDEELIKNVKKRHREYVPLAVKVSRLPFTVDQPSQYLMESGIQFCKKNSPSESLFLDWISSECESVVDDQLINYMPHLHESCKVKIGDEDWHTYNRFEAKRRIGGYSIFVGACIQCIRWVPGEYNSNSDKFLSVASHLDSDLPRYELGDTPQHCGMIQIWNFADMKSKPKMVLGIAHDFGTVWDMDWCPSGARDLVPEENVHEVSRLGLLTVACSNGNAYVFSVPYPSTILQKSDQLIYKLKPVAELRLTMGSERQVFQATSIRWSQQKDNSFIIVGYGDGTTAYFDLNSESPLLKIKRDFITTFYPYYDERPHNSTVLCLDVYPSGDASVGAGAVCSTSPTGGAAASRPGLRPARLHSRLASAVAAFQPLWPAAMLAGDDSLISTSANELEWWGGGRRLGAVSQCAGCVFCARVATYQAPMLRVTRLHPVYTDTKKHTIGILQMSPIGKKRKFLADELATKLEPIIYEDTVEKYGIELRLGKNIQAPQMNKPRDTFPERFPLADVRSMAFCPFINHHRQLAVATHAGIIFLVTVG